MPRIQTAWLWCLIACTLAACTPDSDALTTEQYLHDIDRAKEEVAKAKNSPADHHLRPSVLNASEALAKLSISRVRKCWPAGDKVSTAATDHDCLMREGFKR